MSNSPHSRSHNGSPPPDKRRACQHCFKRKMRCDGYPCETCKTAGRECVQLAKTTRPRPTHERIDKLEGELANLQGFLNNLAIMPSDKAQAALEQWRTTNSLPPSETFADGRNRAYSLQGSGGGDFPTPSVFISTSMSEDGLSASTTRSRFRHGQFGHVSAHGPTSAFFDEVAGDEGKFTTPRHDKEQLAAEDALREQATAKAAEEKHLEILNLACGKLDFDGVAPDLAMHLLGLHWNRQHFGFMVSYRPLFMRDMACAGPYFSKLLLNAIYFSVSKFSDRVLVYDDPQDQKSAGGCFLRRVKQLMGEALDQSSIPTAQAMLLLSSSLFALGQHSAAWLYSGIAVRMIFDLGLNYSVPDNLPAADIEIRRRVVWSAFVYDKIISLYQGRAVSFDEDQMHVPHRFLDTYEEQEQWTPYAFPGIHGYPGAAARAISTFSAFCALAAIMGRVISSIYGESASPDRPSDSLQRLSASLDKWMASLPAVIAYDPTNDMAPVPPPHVLSLHMVYWTVVTLLHRPFVETGHHHLSDAAKIAISWTKCEEAAKGATSLLSRYRQTFSLARAPYLISYTTYVAATIHVRIAAQRGPHSDAGKLLGVCLEALRENSATNPGVQKMHGTILTLMTKLNVELSPPKVGVEPTAADMTFLTEGLDLEAIIRSFGGDQMLQGGFGVGDMNGQEGAMANVPYDQTQDSLFGFLNFQ